MSNETEDTELETHKKTDDTEFAEHKAKRKEKVWDGVWSNSKLNTAEECLYKYHHVYVLGNALEAPYFTLGSQVHSVIEKCLKNGIRDALEVRNLMDLSKNLDPVAYTFIPYIITFLAKIDKLEAERDFKFVIEERFGITKGLEKTSFFGKDLFLRGIFDMWAYDPKEKMLVIIDHKTSKSMKKEAELEQDRQLLMYIWILAKANNIEWERAHIAHNYIRQGKLVWAVVYPEELEIFEKDLMKFVERITLRVREANAAGNWPREKSWKCRFCPMKLDCEEVIEPETFEESDIENVPELKAAEGEDDGG